MRLAQERARNSNSKDFKLFVHSNHRNNRYRRTCEVGQNEFINILYMSISKNQTELPKEELDFVRTVKAYVPIVILSSDVTAKQNEKAIGFFGAYFTKGESWPMRPHCKEALTFIF